MWMGGLKLKSICAYSSECIGKRWRRWQHDAVQYNTNTCKLLPYLLVSVAPHWPLESTRYNISTPTDAAMAPRTIIDFCSDIGTDGRIDGAPPFPISANPPEDIEKMPTLPVSLRITHTNMCARASCFLEWLVLIFKHTNLRFGSNTKLQNISFMLPSEQSVLCSHPDISRPGEQLGTRTNKAARTSVADLSEYG